MGKQKSVKKAETGGHRKWKDHEIKLMLDYCLITVQANRLIEVIRALS